MKMKGILLSYMKPKNERQKKAFDMIVKAIREAGIDATIKERDTVACEDTKKDAVFVLGGDGTFLRTARCVDSKVPMLGINLDPSRKEGGLLQSDPKMFKRHLKIIIEGKAKTIRLSRLEARINKKKIGLALNEFYIGFQKAYHTARYEIIHNKKKEYQKSSGLLIGTAAGSTGWIKSAGGNVLPKTSKKFQLVAREVFCSRLTGCSIRHMIFDEHEKVRIRSDMDSGIIVADSSDNEHMFNKDDLIEISVSKMPVSYFVF